MRVRTVAGGCVGVASGPESVVTGGAVSGGALGLPVAVTSPTTSGPVSPASTVGGVASAVWFGPTVNGVRSGRPAAAADVTGGALAGVTGRAVAVFAFLTAALFTVADRGGD